MPEPCTCASSEGKEPHHVAVFSDPPFETLLREDLGDYHGATPHQGRLRCRACGATFAYVSELTSTVITRETDVDRVIAFLRAGQEAQVGGGRCFSIYVIRGGQPIIIQSDEGHRDEVSVDEARLRELIAAEPALFLDYLQIWQR